MQILLFDIIFYFVCNALAMGKVLKKSDVNHDEIAYIQKYVRDHSAHDIYIQRLRTNERSGY